MRSLLLSFSTCLILIQSFISPSYAGCDRDIKDVNLNVAGPMNEKEILALIRQAQRESENQVEQAKVYQEGTYK